MFCTIALNQLDIFIRDSISFDQSGTKILVPDT